MYDYQTRIMYKECCNDIYDFDKIIDELFIENNYENKVNIRIINACSILTEKYAGIAY